MPDIQCTLCGQAGHRASHCPRNRVSLGRLRAALPGAPASGAFSSVGVVIHADSIGDDAPRGNPLTRQWGGGVQRARKPLERANRNPSLFALVVREADPIGALFGVLARRAG